MKPIRCIVADDNELDRLTISGYLSHFPEIELIKIFENPLEALPVIEQENPDVIFLDVDMPGMSGLELRKKVSQIQICIFTTDHPEYAVESFELETLDYLVKPYTFERFSKTIDRIKEYMTVLSRYSKFEEQSDESHIFIKTGHKKVKVAIDSILYLNSLQNYTIVLNLEEKHYMLSSLGTLLTDKNFSSFSRVHKSYAVNRNHIKSIDSKEITLTNGTKVPIGRSYKSAVENILFEKE